MMKSGILAGFLTIICIKVSDTEGNSIYYPYNLMPNNLEIGIPDEQLDITARIVGGRDALPVEFPHQVALFIYFEGGNIQLCGGSLISRHYVLTAAHCLDSSILAQIWLGTNILQDISQGLIRVLSKEFIIHQNWTRKAAMNDIALIKLLKPVMYSDRIQPVNLPRRKIAANDLTNVIATTCGWGDLSDKVNLPSTFLHCVDLKVISAHECRKYFPFIVRSKHICVDGSEGKATCGGDSGGSLILQEKDGNRTIIGITSFGLKFGCESIYPSVFARVTSYLDWISLHTGIKIRD